MMSMIPTTTATAQEVMDYDTWVEQRDALARELCAAETGDPDREVSPVPASEVELPGSRGYLFTVPLVPLWRWWVPAATRQLIETRPSNAVSVARHPVDMMDNPRP